MPDTGSGINGRMDAIEAEMRYVITLHNQMRQRMDAQLDVIDGTNGDIDTLSASMFKMRRHVRHLQNMCIMMSVIMLLLVCYVGWQLAC